MKSGLTKDEQELIALADEMASAMADLNAQTYDTFMSARDRFRSKVKQMCDEHNHNLKRLSEIKATVLSI